MLCYLPASIEALLAGSRMPECSLGGLSLCLTRVRLSQSAILGCVASGALVQSWENFQRGLVARALLVQLIHLAAISRLSSAFLNG